MILRRPLSQGLVVAQDVCSSKCDVKIYNVCQNIYEYIIYVYYFCTAVISVLFLWLSYREGVILEVAECNYLEVTLSIVLVAKQDVLLDSAA